MTGHQRTLSLRSTGDHSRSTECPPRPNEGSLSSRSSSQPNAAHLRKRPFEGDCICCISAIISVISAAWLGIIFVAPTKANLTRLPSTSWFLLASDLNSCLQICRIRSCEANSSSGCSCTISVVQQGFERAEDRLFLVSVLLHSCLPQ